MNIEILWVLLLLLCVGTIFSILGVWRYAKNIRRHLDEGQIGAEESAANGTDEVVISNTHLKELIDLISSIKQTNYDTSIPILQETNPVNVKVQTIIPERNGTNDALAVIASNNIDQSRNNLRRIK